MQKCQSYVETFGRAVVSIGNLNSTTTTGLCIHIWVQKLKCCVLSRACKHKPDPHIVPYWSDRLSRKLVQNTNTAWGGSLKLETILLSVVFSSSGNHLVAHAYQVLSPSLILRSAFFRLCCLLQCLCNGGFKKNTHTLKLQDNLSNLCILVILKRCHAFVAAKKQHLKAFLFHHLLGNTYATVQQGKVRMAGCFQVQAELFSSL